MAEDFQALQRRLAAHLRDPTRPPPEVGERGLSVYRNLFFSNVKSFLSGAFPVLRKLYADDDWNELARLFYARHRCHSPYFAEIPREFIAYLEDEHERRPCDPPFALELAHYEWLELALARATDETDAATINPDGDLMRGVPVPSPLAWQQAYEWPVHRIGPDFRPEQPGAVPTWLVVFRDRKDRVRFLALNRLSALLLEKITEQNGATGAELIRQVARDLVIENVDNALHSGRQMLETMRAKEILLGTRRSSKPSPSGRERRTPPTLS